MNKSTIPVGVLSFLSFLVLGASSLAQEIGFVEDYDLAEDRAQAIETLVPGTEEYFYFHCLQYQNTEQFDLAQKTLDDWHKKFGWTGQASQMRNRQMLLTYSSDPKATLAYLKQQLGLNFSHERELPEAERNLPNRLSSDQISYEAFRNRALKNHLTDGFEDAALERLAASDIDDAHLRHLLQRLQRPDIPDLPKLVARELAMRDAGGFGSMAVHRAMTRQQLDELVKLVPRLAADSNYVQIYLTKLQPNEDVSLAADEDAQFEYLDRLWAFAAPLNPAFNSLKASILFRRLDLDRRRGEYNKERFLEYLKVPRRVFYIRDDFLRKVTDNAHFASLDADYSQFTGIPVIGNDEPLVRDYLQHFFVDADDIKEFETFVDTNYLRRQFAETKITHGLGDRQRFASWLTAEEYKALIDRVDLDFAWTNKRQFGVDEPVELKLAVKNVDTLLIKVFEINTRNFYEQNLREIDSDVNLDGLVPHHEETIKYNEPPHLRVERTFKFDSIDHRGVYVIDFIGNGHSSRALIRKGQLYHIVDTTVAGQAFTILDENRQPIKDAELWVGGQYFKPIENGQIVVPFSTQPGPQPVILSRGSFSVLSSFNHEAETYSLSAGMFVDREALLRNRTASVTIRAGLRLNGVPVPFEKMLKEPRLIVTAVDLDGITSTREYPAIELHDDRETIQTFQVPSRLRQINFALTGKVDVISRAEPQTVIATASFVVNEIDATESIRDVFLVGSPGGYSLEVRGKTGETRVKQAVQLSIKHEQFREPYQTTLQTDESGRIDLGPLTGIDNFSATLAGTPTRSWSLPRPHQTQFRSLHAAAGQAIRVAQALADRDLAEQLSLLEIRGGTYVTDRTPSVTPIDGGVEIAGLDPGDYELRFKETGEVVTLRVAQPNQTKDQSAEGTTSVGHVVLGKSRLLEMRTPDPLRVAETNVNDQKITIHLEGTSPATRVHLFADRYVTNGFDSWTALQQVRNAEPIWVRLGFRESSYVTGRDIGDEYRYILDRKYAPKYPGVMLQRPSLLLNPWAIRNTENQVQVAAEGDEFGGVGGGAEANQSREPGQSAGGGGFQDPATVDFLKSSSIVMSNLQPDENGMVTIDRKALGEKHFLQIVAVDNSVTCSQPLYLPSPQPELHDLRLAVGLDPEKNFAQQKQTVVLPADKPFTLDDVGSAKFQQYDDLGDVYRLFMSLSNNSTLAEFNFILDWPKKTDAEKRELYSKYACHELNFFLLKKDPKFFESVIAPYLANKRDQTFLDRWLLKSSLDGFVDPWQFQRLNVAEKILLSQSSEANRNHIARWIRESYDVNPTKRQVFDQLFDTAIKGAALDEESLGVKLGDVANYPATLSEIQNSTNDVQRSVAAPSSPSGRAGGGGAVGGALEAESKSLAFGADKAAGKKIAEHARRELAKEKEVAEADRKDSGKQKADANVLRDELARGKGEQLAWDGKSPSTEDFLKLRAQQERLLYRRIPPTQEWVENNYYKLPIQQQVADLITINRFWRDYAAHAPNESFLSPYFPEATRNFSEMMLALAVLDLPLESTEQKADIAENQLKLTPTNDMIAFYQQVTPAAFDDRGSNVLVAENFFRDDDRYRQEGSQRFDKFVTDEFLVHVLYGAQVVLTNPTSTPQAIDLLVQIPQGSLPAKGSQITRTLQLDLQPFSTQTFEYSFYFPYSGQFTHYPAHVALENRVIAAAQKMPFNVVDQATRIDRSSWAYVSQNGTNDDVLEFLGRENLFPIDLSKIAFRMRDKEFFQNVISLLHDRMAYDQVLWAYSVYHNDVSVINEFLAHADDFLHNCGPALVSPLATIDPIDRRWYEHKEYWPLANARAHQLGRRRQITNPTINEQYHELLGVLSCRREYSPSERMQLTYYLLLQDRFAEALTQFERVPRESIAAQLQYDYMASYVSLLKEELDGAEQIAKRRVDYPVDRWSKLFKTVLAHVTEARGGEPDPSDPANREQKQAELAAKLPGFDFDVESRKIDLHYQNLDAVTVNYYTMDIELLFSTNPFVQQRTDGFSIIRPNFSQTVPLAGDAKEKTLDLPEQFHNANVLVEIVGAGQVKSKPYFANSLTLNMNENYGQLQVVHQGDNKPLSKVYVKVYAQKADGSTSFYKDGYTDVRGRFDYASLSNQSLDDVRRYSLLVFSDQYGAIVREASVPVE